MEPEISVDGSLSAVIACLFNIGPGLAEVGPTRNYAGLHDTTKFMLSVLMIMGRLELYAILALFSPSLWRRFS
jgi:trk system potassium uptake protein TrkH